MSLGSNGGPPWSLLYALDCMRHMERGAQKSAIQGQVMSEAHSRNHISPSANGMSLRVCIHAYLYMSSLCSESHRLQKRISTSRNIQDTDRKPLLATLQRGAQPSVSSYWKRGQDLWANAGSVAQWFPSKDGFSFNETGTSLEKRLSGSNLLRLSLLFTHTTHTATWLHLCYKCYKSLPPASVLQGSVSTKLLALGTTFLVFCMFFVVTWIHTNIVQRMDADTCHPFCVL